MRDAAADKTFKLLRPLPLAEAETYLVSVMPSTDMTALPEIRIVYIRLLTQPTVVPDARAWSVSAASA